MGRCSVIGCKSDSERKIAGISFHGFPIKPHLRQIWIAATGRNGWEPKKQSKICSIHFDTSLITKKTRITRLDPNAVPSKFIKGADAKTRDPLPSTSTMDIDYNADTNINEATMRTLQNIPFGQLDVHGQSSSTLKINLQCDSFVNANPAEKTAKSPPVKSPEFTPKTMRRKWKIEKIKSEERFKKLRALREKSRRLTKKVATLENIIVDLKSKSLVCEEDCDILASVETFNKDF